MFCGKGKEEREKKKKRVCERHLEKCDWLWVRLHEMSSTPFIPVAHITLTYNTAAASFNIYIYLGLIYKGNKKRGKKQNLKRIYKEKTHIIKTKPFKNGAALTILIKHSHCGVGNI